MLLDLEEIMVEQGNIYITPYDLWRLSDLLQVLNYHKKNAPHVAALRAELDRADVVEQTAIPRDVVTMNSRVRVCDLDTGEEREFTVVFPKDADISQNKVSILAPIGMALLGTQMADTVEYKVPAGVKRFRIEEVLYQPEAAGNYYL